MILATLKLVILKSEGSEAAEAMKNLHLYPRGSSDITEILRSLRSLRMTLNKVAKNRRHYPNSDRTSPASTWPQ